MLSAKPTEEQRGSVVRLDERWKNELTSNEQEAICDVMRGVPLLAQRYIAAQPHAVG